jgi:benzoyl-CoA reductase/2-hydroxyglutaryl-CoA dehydratase subunit BcrC/BadD/HgdB
MGKSSFNRGGQRAKGIWMDFTARHMKAALKRDGLVVWANAFFPFELLYGLDVIPLRPETISAIASSFGLARDAISRAEAACYSPDTCSFYRCAAGLNIKGLLPPPDIVVSTSILCEGAVKEFSNIAQYYGCEHYLLDVPYRDTPQSRKYLAGQLEELAEIIAKKQGKPVDSAKMAEAVRLSNEARDYLSKTNELRKIKPCPLSGEDALSHMLDMQFFGPGSKAGVAYFKAMYEELDAMVGRGEGAVQNERFRLLWLHYIKPYYPNEILSFLEGAGAAVCFGESSHVYWEPMDPEKPYQGMAAKLLSNPSGGPLERRADLAVKLAGEYGVDGVIHFTHWGCRQSSGGEYIIRDRMRERGMPMLILDGDGTDSRNYSKEQTRLRLEAFVEMLEAKR